MYEKAFGHGSGYREAGKEILTFRLSVMGMLKKPDIKAEMTTKSDGTEALKGERDVYFEENRKFVSHESTILRRCKRERSSPARRSSKRRSPQ